MVDIEGQIFSAVSAALKAAFTGIYVTGEYTGSPPSFPCATVEEVDNSVYTASQSNNIENHANLPYEINVYSNKTAGRKSETKAIIKVADGVMVGYGFTRIFCQSTPNTADATIYRKTARYTAVADVHTETIYRG